MNEKPRSDAKLKTLPPERQAAIADYGREHSLSETIIWLRSDGISSSSGALSEFLSWYGLRQRFQHFEHNSLTLIELLKQRQPGISQNALDSYASEYFQVQSLKMDDPKTYLAFATARTEAEFEKQRIRIKEDTLALSQAKFQRETADLFLKWFEDKRAREVAASPATNAEKIERLGELMFGEDWKQ